MLIVLVAGMASGKNKIAETLNIYGVKSLVSTASRPKRKDEEEGVEYYFKTKEELIDMICNDKVVEYRIYDTQYGKWYYCLEKEEVADKDIVNNNYVVILDWFGANHLKEYMKDLGLLDYVKTVYVDCDAKTRLLRSLDRDDMDDDKVAECCRRFLDDNKKVIIFKDKCDYIVKNNSWLDFEEALEKILNICKIY